MSQDRYIVLLSGGLDSVVNLYEAQKHGEVVCALTFSYGQRAASQEIRSGAYFCEKLGVKHETIEISWLGKLTNTALVNRSQGLPKLKDLDNFAEASESARAVWVPNRNGIFLNIAAAYAESLKAQYIVPGFNKEEATTFPDNSQGFIDACDGAFQFSTMNHVKVICFTTNLDKVEMVTKADKFGIDFEKVWSCYENGEAPCGNCESCQRTMRALEVAGL